MTYRVWGDVFDSGELSDTSMFCPVIPNRDMILRAIRTWIIIVNDPTYTDISCKLYSNNESGEPGVLIASSTDARTKSEITTYANGVREIYLTFDDIPLNGNTTYNFVMSATGYTPTSSSYLAWKKGWPDPVYDYETPLTFESLSVSPYALYMIGGEF